MSNEQLLFAIGAPILFNGLGLLLLTITLNRRIDDLASCVANLERCMGGLEQGLGSFLTKDDLRRFEQVLDVRVQRIEAKLARH